jgi:hypothetical protein
VQNELVYFATPLFDTYEREGFLYHHVEMGSLDAKNRVMEYSFLLPFQFFCMSICLYENRAQ